MQQQPKAEESAEQRMRRLLAAGGVIIRYDFSAKAHFTDGHSEPAALTVIRSLNGSLHHFIGPDPKAMGLQVPQTPRQFFLNIEPTATRVDPT